MRKEDKTKFKILAHRVFLENCYFTDGISAFRTEPLGENRGFRAFIKTRWGEEEISPTSNTLNRILCEELLERELTKEEYENWSIFSQF